MRRANRDRGRRLCRLPGGARRRRHQRHPGTRGAHMIEDTLREAEAKMSRAIEVAKEEFSGIRTGRANPALVNRLTVDYYGAPTPLQQLASIAAPEARLLVVSPYDRNASAAIERAIRNARRHSKEVLERLEKDAEISQDELHRAEQKLQQVTDKYVAEVDSLLQHKERELLEV